MQTDGELIATIISTLDAKASPVKLLSYRRVNAAFVVAAVIALPTYFERSFQNDHTSLAIITLNLPGILLGLFHGRYFPPEGFIGQSPVRAAAMILAQTVVW